VAVTGAFTPLAGPRRPTFSESWHRVGPLRPRLRVGIAAYRQRFRGQTWHVLEDPLGGGSAGRSGGAPGASGFFRLNDSAWRFVALLDGRRTVSEAWKIACESLGDDAPTQPEAVTLLGQLGASNLLQGDVPQDTQALFQRYRKRTSRETRATLSSVLSIRLPLFDPDRFLTAITPIAGPAFTWAGAAVWLVLLTFGLAHLTGRWDELLSGAGSVLGPANLPWLGAVFVACKLVHELGHGVACKWFAKRQGLAGEVHALGVMLLVGMPAPYVDATSAWALRSPWQRAAVGAAGMYAELALASLAAIVWARTAEGSLTHALCYNAVFVAGVSTIIFNANPLLKYDGYYILSDLAGAPNLAQRAREQAFHLVRSIAWGDRQSVSPAASTREGAWLLVYFAGSTAYRLMVFAGIALFIMGQWFVLGVAIGAAMIFGMLVAPAARLVSYLSASPALSRNRSRAVLTTLGTMTLAVGVVTLVPVPERLRLPGVVEAARTADVFAPEDGFLRSLLAEGKAAEATELFVLENPELSSQAAQARARLAGAAAQRRRAVADDPTMARLADEKSALLKAAADEAALRLERLRVRAPFAGVWACRSAGAGPMVGSFFRRGERIGTLVQPQPVHVVAVADQAASTRVTSLGAGITGAGASARCVGEPGRLIPVQLRPPAPAGTAELPHPALADEAGGPIRTASGSSDAPPRPREGVFTLRADPLDPSLADHLLPGERVALRIDLPPSTLASQWTRSLRQTFQQRFGVGW